MSAGAGRGNRTLDSTLGRSRFTPKLYPHLTPDSFAGSIAPDKRSDRPKYPIDNRDNCDSEHKDYRKICNHCSTLRIIWSR